MAGWHRSRSRISEKERRPNRTEGKTANAAVKNILFSNPDGLRDVIRAVMQEVLAPARCSIVRTHKATGSR